MGLWDLILHVECMAEGSPFPPSYRGARLSFLRGSRRPRGRAPSTLPVLPARVHGDSRARGRGATVTAMPYNIDWCDDTGRNNRAGGSIRAGDLTRASCAQPVRILTITP